MAETSTPDAIYYGAIPNMVAEVSALSMPAEWLKAQGFRYCLMPVGEAQFETEFFETIKDCCAQARIYGREIGVPVRRV